METFIRDEVLMVKIYKTSCHTKAGMRKKKQARALYHRIAHPVNMDKRIFMPMQIDGIIVGEATRARYVLHFAEKREPVNEVKPVHYTALSDRDR